MVRHPALTAAAAAGKGKSGQNDDHGHKNLAKTTLTWQCGARCPQKAHWQTYSSVSTVRMKNVVFTILHEKAGRKQLHRVIG
jgi:hypothetical protein